MILIDKVQHTAEEVAEMFNVPLDKIKRTPEFLINPKDNKGGGLNPKAGTRVMANIIVKLNGKSVEIRYAETINETFIGEKLVPEYYPRKITFEGEATIIRDDNMDLAVYMYLFPLNRNSPFRKGEAFSWYFKDIEAESAVEMEANTALMESMYQISDLNGEPLRIVAKGFGLAGVAALPDNAIKSQLVAMAKRDPLEFNKNIGSQQTQFRGLILNGIDTGLFVVKQRGANETWMWGAGQSAGQPIVDIVDKGVAPADILVDQILYKITEYYPILVSAVKAVNAKATADDYLATTDLNVKTLFADVATKRTPASEFGGGTEEVSDVPVDLSGANDAEDLGTDPGMVEEETDDFEIPAFLQDKPTKPAPKKAAAAKK